ncbi:MAG: hypothetical protein IJC88_05135 [Oscillospiraceae bacterium]|nr:hypothetical protein [Oscillospiraceae bacterium]
MLQVGFARMDITPPLGSKISGYFEERLADGVLDPILATAVVFDDGTHRALVMSLDLIGIPQSFMAQLRLKIAGAAKTVPEAVYLACTHTHVGPCTVNAKGDVENPDYVALLPSRLSDLAVLAVADLAPATLLCTRGRAEDVAFIRRFRMKDGSVQTNPGFQNPNIDHPLGTPDEESSLLIVKREGKREIGIVNFGVHPDVIGGCTLTADFPKFVRDTYETIVPNSLCMFLNGAQGDLNHIDTSLKLGCDLTHGYERAKYMGKKIALSVVSNYELARPIQGEAIRFGQKSIFVRHNKGTPEELEWAKRISQIYHEEGLDAATPEYEGMQKIEVTAKAERIVRLSSLPDEKELLLSAIAVGDMVFAGFPGEPFCAVGQSVKRNSDFALTLPTCCTNGYEGYYPTQNAFDEGGYEALTARYVPGTAEQLIEASLSLIQSLK